MPRLAFRSRSLPFVALLVAGCASLPAPATRPPALMAARLQQVMDSLDEVNALEEDEIASAPRIRLYVPPVGFALDRYVETSFHLSSDAYVLVVAVDLDRRVRVLYPELPDESGFASRKESNRLPRFFAGFGTTSLHGTRTYLTSYDVTQTISPFGGGGVLLAVASDRPLQFERLLGPDGYWDENALSRLVFDQTMPGAAHALARTIVLTGQDYNTDYTTFTGDRTLGAYAFAAHRLSDRCGLSSGFSRAGYAYGWDDVRSAGAMARFVGLFQRNGQTFARYVQGGCAGASYYDVPVAGEPRPVPPDSAAVPDTSTKRKPMHPAAPRFPSVTADGGAATGREVHVRLEPSGMDRGRERPLSTAGLRFRTASELPDAGEPSTEARRPGHASAIARVPQRDVERRQLPERTMTARPERVAETRASEATVRESTTPPQPAREAPVRETPVRETPVREAPVRERVHREPVERTTTPAAPITP